MIKYTELGFDTLYYNYTRHLTLISSAFSLKFWNDVPFPNSSPSALLTTHPSYTIKTQGKLPGGIDGSTYTPYARGQVLPYRNKMETAEVDFP